MCLNIFKNNEWYYPISVDQISLFAEELRSLCIESYSRGLIDVQTFEFLNPKHSRLATFYALPKVHNNLSDPPGRPVISGNESLTEKASRYADSVSMPNVTCLPSYIRDTSDAVP